MKGVLLILLSGLPEKPQTDVMQSKAGNLSYSEGWERVFGKKEEEELDWEIPMPPKSQLN